MAHLHSQEYLRLLGRERGLYSHLYWNLHPRLPFYVIDTVRKNFRKYWEEKFSAAQLLENINKDLKEEDGQIIGLKSLDKFVEFLNEKDKEVSLNGRKY